MNVDPRLIRYIQKDRWPLGLTIASGALAGILTIGQAYLLSQIVNRVFLTQARLSSVWGQLTWTALIIFGRGLMVWLNRGTAKTAAVHIKRHVRSLLLEHLDRLGPAYTQKEQSGELASTLVEGVEKLDAYITQYLPQLAISALIPTSILIFVFPRDPLSGAVLLVTAPLIPVFMILIGRTAQKMTDRQFQTMNRLAAQFLDSLQGLTTLKIFGRAEKRKRSIAETSDQFRSRTMKVLRVAFLSALVLELLATISTALVAVQIGLRLLYARISFQNAFFLLIIAPEFYIPLRRLGLYFHAGMEGKSAARRIFAILDEDPLGEDRQEPLTSPPRQFSTVQFEGVHFSYPDEPVPVLRDVNLSLNSGQRLALVGTSGGGKTTITQLLLGFFTPDRGHVRIDDQLLSEIDLAEWRSHIAWVPQEPILFHDTVAANLRVAKPEASQEELQAAVKAANLKEAIDALPQGYETPIGEGGIRLSGGEAQRLALARAFLKDAPLVLLDEPTSQLDPVTERQLMGATRRLMVGRTVMIIAHRLNTVYEADQILLVENGTIAAQGTHQELIGQSDLYRNFVSAYTTGWATTPAFDPTGSPHESQPPGRTDLGRPWDRTQNIQAVESEQRPSKSPARVFIRLLSFLGPHWQRVALSILLGTLTIASSVGLMGASAWLISAAALHPPLSHLSVAIVGVRFFGIARGISRYFERLTTHDVTFRILTRLRVWFYTALEPLAPARTMYHHAGDLLSTLASDVNALEDFYVRGIAPPLVAALIGTGTSLYLGTYHPRLGWMFLIFTVLVGLGIPLLTRHLSRSPGQAMSRRKSHLHTSVLDYLQGLPILAAYNRTSAYRQRCLQRENSLGSTQTSLGWITGINDGLSTTLTHLGMWSLLIAAVPLVENGSLSGVLLATVLMMALSSFEAVQPLSTSGQILSSSLQAGRRLFRVVDQDPEIVDPPHTPPLPSEPGIAIQNLTFTYPTETYPALHDLTLHLPAGKHAAVVGPSGAGKTTLLNLLLRFWDDPTRSIQLVPSGHPLSAYPQKCVRRLYSVIPQKGYFFHDTVLHNLKLAKPGSSLEEVVGSARSAGIHQIIQELPQGYLTMMGEMGARFSAGERQRLAIARALLKNAPVFLLDEPFANLDPVTEKRVLSDLFDNLKEKTLLLITHRLVGLDRMDEILVLDQGRVVERGHHQRLLANQGLYYQMWVTQNRIIASS